MKKITEKSQKNHQKFCKNGIEVRKIVQKNGQKLVKNLRKKCRKMSENRTTIDEKIIKIM